MVEWTQMLRAIEQTINQGNTTLQVVVISATTGFTMLIGERFLGYIEHRIRMWRGRKKDSYSSMYSRHRKGDQA